MQVASNKKKRRISNESSEKSGAIIDKDALCSFCNGTPAAVLVKMPSIRKRKEGPQPFCLLHYYTTRAIRLDPSNVSVLNQDQLDYQLENGGVQELFAEAYTELQKELGEESARSFRAHKSDPLAVLMDIRGKPKKRPTAPSAQKTRKLPSNAETAGGFLQSTALPDRMRRQQEQQQYLRAQQAARIHEANSTANPYKRRKAAKTSIWNLAMNEYVKTTTVPTPADSAQMTQEADIKCSCGSKKVSIFGNITGRNSDRKGETWGNKERNDAMVTRYQCSSCGKVWNEEE